MACKKLLNEPLKAVDDAIQGLVAVNNNLITICNGRVVIRGDLNSQAGKVALICGGGSGHEPAWAGYVGPGMLTAAVCGNIFASPPTSTVYETILCCAKDNPAGVLVIVKNYTGDRVNFGLAIERARAIGIRCEMVVIADDCALTSTDRSAGRRGLCGAMFVHKIAGAMAQEGRSLDEIVQMCEAVTGGMGTIGVSLGACSLPGAHQPLFTLPQGQMELGLGIHGEAGVRRVDLKQSHEVVKDMYDHITNPDSASRLNLKQGDRVAVIINNLGGTSQLELSIVARDVLQLSEERGLKVERVYSGMFVTSLEMPGISVTYLILDEEMIKYLDAPTQAPAWSCPWRSDEPAGFHYQPSHHAVVPESVAKSALKVEAATGNAIKSAIIAACQEVISKEESLNQLDEGCGDGDTGSTLKQGCQALIELLGSLEEDMLLRPACLLMYMSSCVEKNMGGTSGALYSLLLSAAASELVDSVTAGQVIAAYDAGLKAVMKYGRGQLGDRTMLDALIPSLNALTQDGELKTRISNCAEAAKQGAQSTAGMKAKAGRASYTPAEHQKQVDPGAEAVAIWMSTVCSHLSALV